MNICFIEDTMLHGGTQLWVVDAVRAYHDQGDMVTLLAPQQSWVNEQCQGSGVNTPTYPFMRPETNHDVLNVNIFNSIGQMVHKTTVNDFYLYSTNSSFLIR